MLEAGIHATIAGVLLGFVVPVKQITPRAVRQEEPALGLAPVLEPRFRPLSNHLAIPVFASFAAGVALGGLDGMVKPVSDPVAIGIVLGSTIATLGGGTLLAVRNRPYKKLREQDVVVDRLDAA